ncbi:TetR family transcriptional regulator [Amycolatopsis coloradensis]|uniref:TetR family transcriptional regulator n=1 Tax=Amycolatopsis coloradensis TaxID=76021 RepID=A0A1R0KWN9_9PSEU|nr:TetR/AcrR family transcriptional regulator [Amycolatopsis coloradensis]OLZ53454.1 TetR family transcriptional regulator [Amycolatopsis coloradensis]
MPVDGRVARGDATRRTVLRRAVDIASVEGLEGLSLGRLATELELSKSGVFALFGSKEELQLAAIETASAIFAENVAGPTMEVERGIARLRALCANWLDYSERRVFPGGCFFFNIGAEFDARTGRVHDAAANASRAFAEFIRTAVVEAKNAGHLRESVDVNRLAFELHALGRAANADSVMFGGTEPYELARAAITARLDAAAS